MKNKLPQTIERESRINAVMAFMKEKQIDGFGNKQAREDFVSIISYKLGVSRRIASEYLRIVEVMKCL